MGQEARDGGVGMQHDYRIRVEYRNAEMEDDDLIEGTEADGFFLMTFRDEKPFMIATSGVSVMNLSEVFKRDESGAVALRQAAAIGEGFRKAKEIHMSARKDLSPLIKMLENFGNGRKQE